MNKKEKLALKDLCLCGHTRGKHSYVEACRCLSCDDCKSFALVENSEVKEKKQ